MQEWPIEKCDPFLVFPQLAEIPQPPKHLFVRGDTTFPEDTIFLAVVGSRALTSYGKQVCRMLIEGLRGYPIVIVSGLALGIDREAHLAAIENGLRTIAFPGSGLHEKALYPAQHRGLAEEILAHGGALFSEYEPHEKAAPWTFPKRNRLMAGVSTMVLIIEAQEKSGTLITARLATDYNKRVGAVPGSITSALSKGSNWLLRLGAVPITESADILSELGLTEQAPRASLSSLILTPEEERLLDALTEPKTREVLMTELSLDASAANVLLSVLEIKGLIRESMGKIERT